MRVGDAARQVGTSARMLRYAEQLGLVAPARTAGGYRDYRERDLLAAAAALRLQARYRVTPAALAFGLRALHDPGVASSLRQLAGLARGRRGPAGGVRPEGSGEPRRGAPVGQGRSPKGCPGGKGRGPEGVPRSIGPPGPATALDFETAKARRLLRLAA
jgi:MerR family transcriptional regulator, copper efflux regulator